MSPQTRKQTRSILRLLLVHRLRRWPNIKRTMGDLLVCAGCYVFDRFAGLTCFRLSYLHRVTDREESGSCLRRSNDLTARQTQVTLSMCKISYM